MKKIFFLLFGLGLLAVGCDKNDNGIENPNPFEPNSDSEVNVQAFMWSAMNLWYFWQDQVPDLADDRFDTNDDFVEFAKLTPNPQDFYNKIQFSEDRFSFSNADYTTLVNNLSGISKSNGLEFGLVQFAGGTGEIFGYVRYIIANSNASTKDIQRGDIFTGVNGQTLTLDNYRELLFGDADTYTLNMAQFNGDVIEPNNEEVTLTKEEGLVENPILVATTLDVNGTKVAYLMYNGFTRDFNDELNNAFGQFVADGATELVLDMRYNPGGSVNTSRLLASMIYGPNTNDLYIRQRWNAKIQEQLSSEQLEDFFANTVDGAALNSLNLNKVYVLATNGSASASELVMNGLDPYIDVIHIGETTRGKNEFSITMVDDRDNNFIYERARENQINPNNSWAIQPLVGRNENADGFFDYTSGFVPDIELEEDLANLGTLGDPSEPLLARALEEITGVSSKSLRFAKSKMPIHAFDGSKLHTGTKDIMYLDKPLDLKIQ